MLSIKLEETVAVLVGASHFTSDPDNLCPLPSVKNNIEDLYKILCDKDIIGIPSKNVIKILDVPKSSDILTKLAEACKSANDTLIVYYAGHGILSKNSSKLYFATIDSTENNANYNAIDSEKIKEAMSESGATKRILIVDSCFSGRIIPNTMGNVSSLLQANFDIKGTYMIASAPNNAASIAKEGEKYTAFTGALIKTLNEGIKNNREDINLKDLYEQIRFHIRNRKDQTPDPLSSNILEGDKINIARNRKFEISKTNYNELVGIVEILYHFHKILKEAEKASGSIWFAGITFAFGPAHQIQKLKKQWNTKYGKPTLEELSDEFNDYFCALLGGTRKHVSKVKLVVLREELLNEKFIEPLYKKGIYAEHLERYPEQLEIVLREIKNFHDRVVDIVKINKHSIVYVEKMIKQAIVTETLKDGIRKKTCVLLDIGTENVGIDEPRGLYSENPQECEKWIAYIEDLYNSVSKS